MMLWPNTLRMITHTFPFYMLPKTHKPGMPPPGQPIISGCGSLLDPIAKYLEFILQPFVAKICSYIKVTFHSV